MSARQRDHLTSRGAATKARLIQAAADLMLANGVAAATLEEVRIRSRTSKSQLYWHFPDKPALVLEVVRFRVSEVMDRERKQLVRVNSIQGLERWRDSTVLRCRSSPGAYACVLGSMASELSDSHDGVREVLGHAFADWRELLVQVLSRMQTARALRPEADTVRLATLLIASLQGGHLLSQVRQDVAPINDALTAAIEHVKSYA